MVATCQQATAAALVSGAVADFSVEMGQGSGYHKFKVDIMSPSPNPSKPCLAPPPAKQGIFFGAPETPAAISCDQSHQGLFIGWGASRYKLVQRAVEQGVNRHGG